MRKYNEIKAEVIARMGGEIEYPARAKFKSFFLYHKGKLIAKETSRDALPKLPTGAGVVESTFDEEAYKLADAPYRAQQKAIGELYDAELRAEHSDLNDETYGIVYGQAYEDGHSAGFDEVALYMDTYADLAQRIIRANIDAIA